MWVIIREGDDSADVIKALTNVANSAWTQFSHEFTPSVSGSSAVFRVVEQMPDWNVTVYLDDVSVYASDASDDGRYKGGYRPRHRSGARARYE